MKMKAAVLREFEKPVTIEEVELAPPKEKEVLVKTAYTGFCRSDLHFMDGDFEFPLPLVLGHEASGVIEEVGPGVTSLKKGRSKHLEYRKKNQERERARRIRNKAEQFCVDIQDKKMG